MRRSISAIIVALGFASAAAAQVPGGAPGGQTFAPPTATAPVRVPDMKKLTDPVGANDLLILTHQTQISPVPEYVTRAMTIQQLMGTILGVGTAGQVGVYVSGGSTLSGQGPFTAGLPVLGNGVLGLQSGGRTGNTTTYAATNGSFINGHCRSTDASLNEIDAGGPCTTGGGGGTVSAGTTGQIAVYPSNGIAVAGVSSLPSLTINNSGLGSGLDINQTISGTSAGSNFNLLNITSDQGVITGQNYGTQLEVQDQMNSTLIQGGRIGVSGLIIQTQPTAAGNVNRHYIGTLGQAQMSAGDGGTNPTTGAQGGFFGLNGIATALNGAVNLLNVSGAEIDVGMQTGSSSRNKFGVFITDLNTDTVSASVNDAGLGISSQGSIGFDVGVDFTDAATSFPVRSMGTLILADPANAATVSRGIYFSSKMSFTNNAIQTPGFAVDPNGNVTAPSLFLDPLGFASLPSCNSGNEGRLFALNNSNTATYDAAITAVGIFHVLAYCNGTGWSAH